MMNLIQLLTDQRAYEGITHSQWGASWNWRWRRVGDDEDRRSPSPEPQTDSRSGLPMKNRRWRWLCIIKHDESFSLIFFLPESEYMESRLRSVECQGAHEAGGRAPHPRGQGVGPLVFIFGEDFLLFFLRHPMEFQVIPRIFVFCT